MFSADGYPSPGRGDYPPGGTEPEPGAVPGHPEAAGYPPGGHVPPPPLHVRTHHQGAGDGTWRGV